MSKIYTKPDGISSSAGEFKKSSHTIRSLSEDLKNVSGSLGIHDSQSQQIKAALGRINQSLISDAAKASSFHEALLKIANAYKQTEQDIAGMSSEIKTGISGPMDFSGSGKSDYLNSFSRLSETLNLIIKYWDDPEKMGEALQDRYMSYSAQDLLDRPEFSEDAWNKASLAQREEMLTKFLAELNAIMGINVTACQFASLGNSTRGQYSPAKNLIKINLDYIDSAKGRSDSYMIMRTMIHEMRHAYQQAVINHPDQYNVSAETRQQWADNYNNYKDASTYGYESYVEQPIEYDAKRFAGQYNDIKGYTPTYAGTW